MSPTIRCRQQGQLLGEMNCRPRRVADCQRQWVGRQMKLDPKPKANYCVWRGRNAIEIHQHSEPCYVMMKVSSSVGNSHLEAKRCKALKDVRIQQQYNIIQYDSCSQYNIMQCNNTIYPPLLMTLPCPWLQMILSWLAAYGGGKWWYDTQTTFNLWWIQEIFYNDNLVMRYIYNYLSSISNWCFVKLTKN